MDAIAVADALSQNYGIAVRAGLHCSPAAHNSLGTLATGCVRFSLGYFTKKQELDHAAFAMNQIAQKGV